jgi:site-specific DNA recombinase
LASASNFLAEDASRVAIYARVSTEDQAERQTVQAQLEFLRRFCTLYNLPVTSEYVDDGWSGTIPLGERRDGRRLLSDAQAGSFDAVLVYRLDRLGRSLAALISAHSALERSNVTIRSATEPFDTSSPIGRFVFQLLGSIAELERATIAERTTMGRDRVARGGRWTNGAIPFGFDLDAEKRLIPSTRLIPILGITEAELVLDIYTRIAAGSSASAEARRLNALGVSTARRYAGEKTVDLSKRGWNVSRMSQMLRNTVYRGLAVLRSRHGPVESEAPALVPGALWEQVQRQLAQNRRLATKNAKRTYLLRGLIACENCGMGFHGVARRKATKEGEWTYYRCNGQLNTHRVESAHRCPAKTVAATWLEDLIWRDCCAFIREPGEVLAEAQRELHAKAEKAADTDGQRQLLEQQIADKDAERERVLTLFRRGHIAVGEAEAQLNQSAEETAVLRQMLTAVTSQAALSTALETHLTQASTLLIELQDRLGDVERSDDLALKRHVIELLVGRIRVSTEGTGWDKRATVTVQYAFGEPKCSSLVNSSQSAISGTAGRAASAPLQAAQISPVRPTTSSAGPAVDGRTPRCWSAAARRAPGSSNSG